MNENEYMGFVFLNELNYCSFTSSKDYFRKKKTVQKAIDREQLSEWRRKE